MKERNLDMYKRILPIIITLILTLAPSASAFAGSHAYSAGSAAGVSISYITIDMNDKSIRPVTMLAGNNMVSAESVASMAQRNGAFAAVNGTYFSAYDGKPIPYGLLIKDGKMIHNPNQGAAAGITADGRLIVDRLKASFAGYINGEYKIIPWRINHPSTEEGAITIFTPEFGGWVPMTAGAKAVVVSGGKASQIVTQSVPIPADGFAVVYNSSVAYLVDERYKIGDSVSYTVSFDPVYTQKQQWETVTCAVGAGPSLIINGQITADGAAEGFTEAKINTNRAGRSFIGGTADGKIIIGTMKSATLAEAAAACQSMGMVNAMCLDGGGSVGLYYNGSVKTSGRAVNNAVGFVQAAGGSGAAVPQGNARGVMQTVMVDGVEKTLQAYNINNNNYFKLRDVAMILNGSEKPFSVDWDENEKLILLKTGISYIPVGGELAGGDTSLRYAEKTASGLSLDSRKILMDAYTVDDSTYFKLRDLEAELGFQVGWDEVQRLITITTK